MTEALVVEVLADWASVARLEPEWNRLLGARDPTRSS